MRAMTYNKHAKGPRFTVQQKNSNSGDAFEIKARHRTNCDECGYPFANKGEKYSWQGTSSAYCRECYFTIVDESLEEEIK